MRRAALLLLATSACWVPVERGRQMEGRIERLEGESQNAAKQLEDQRATLRERIAQVDRKLAQLDAVAHRTGADAAVSVDKLAEEVRALRGSLEEQNHRFEQLEQQAVQQKSDTDRRFAALQGPAALAEYESRKKAEALKRPADKAGFLALAQQQESQGERGVARELYEEYVKKWPSDPRAADAHFRLGELWFGDKRWREAVVEYGKVVQGFPRSDKAPDAMLRTGEAMVALDLRTEAANVYGELAKRYPSTTAATKAKARLAELKAKKVGPKKR